MTIPTYMSLLIITTGLERFPQVRQPKNMIGTGSSSAGTSAAKDGSSSGTRRVSVVVQDAATEKLKAEQEALGELKLHHCEMPAEQTDYIVQLAAKGLKALHKGEKVSNLIIPTIA